MESLRHGLRDLGYIEGKNIDMALQYADGDYTRLPALAEELVRLAPRVILTDARLSTFEVKKASSTIPIVSPFLTDPTGLGLAASDARPGGQVTGILFTFDSLPGKQLEIALEIVPGAKKIGVLSNATNPAQGFHDATPKQALLHWRLNLCPRSFMDPATWMQRFRRLPGNVWTLFLSSQIHCS
jgi:putative tryptophan/tyrosine transport system substrate-binding protein